MPSSRKSFGFGDSFREPLLIDNTDEQRQGERAYRFDSDGRYSILMQRDDGADGAW
jgi:hypothetical protein